MKRKSVELAEDQPAEQTTCSSSNNSSTMDEDKTGGGDGWAALPWVPLLEAFSLLDRPSHLARAGLVCRAWHAAATDNRVWRRLCQRDWRIRRPLGT